LVATAGTCDANGNAQTVTTFDLSPCDALIKSLVSAKLLQGG
jgi:hypothetical protein